MRNDDPELKAIYRRQMEANDIAHCLTPQYVATCTECGLVVENTEHGRAAMLAAHDLLRDGWMAVGPVMSQKLLCPGCSVL